MAAPHKYDKTRDEEVISLMSEGASIVEVCGLLEISRETFYNWTDKNHESYREEFFDTITKGLIQSQIWWEKTARDNIGEKTFQTALWIFNMKNRFRDDWRDKQEIEQTTTVHKVIKPKGVED